MVAARHARHAASTSRGGRHAAPPSRPRQRPQPVGPVLLGVTVGAFGLVALLPTVGAAQVGQPPAGLPPTVAPALSATTDTTLTSGVLAGRLQAAATRSRVQAAKPVATLAPKPVDPLPGCTVSARAATRYDNGQIARSALCALAGHPEHRLRADAARSFARLDAAYRAAFGERLCVTDSYRSLSAQYALARAKPRLAGRPGRSEHGFGVAVDLACGADGFGTRTHRWLEANAGTHGWYQPRWAQRGGGRPEPWHWELRD